MVRFVIGLLLAFSLLVSGSVTTYLLFFRTPTSPVAFDSDSWRFGDRNLRARMVSSLLVEPRAAHPGATVRGKISKDSPIHSKNPTEVMKMLGTPIHIESRGDGFPIEKIKYQLGKRGYTFKGPFVFNIYFDANEIAESFFVGN